MWKAFHNWELIYLPHVETDDRWGYECSKAEANGRIMNAKEWKLYDYGQVLISLLQRWSRDISTIVTYNVKFFK